MAPGYKTDEEISATACICFFLDQPAPGSDNGGSKRTRHHVTHAGRQSSSSLFEPLRANRRPCRIKTQRDGLVMGDQIVRRHVLCRRGRLSGSQRAWGAEKYSVCPGGRCGGGLSWTCFCTPDTLHVIVAIHAPEAVWCCSIDASSGLCRAHINKFKLWDDGHHLLGLPTAGQARSGVDTLGVGCTNKPIFKPVWPGGGGPGVKVFPPAHSHHPEDRPALPRGQS